MPPYWVGDLGELTQTSDTRTVSPQTTSRTPCCHTISPELIAGGTRTHANLTPWLSPLPHAFSSRAAAHWASLMRMELSESQSLRDMALSHPGVIDCAIVIAAAYTTECNASKQEVSRPQILFR